MCEPTTLAVASLALAAYGTVQQANAQKAAGKAQRQQAEYQAAVSRNNKILADRKATDARDRGDINAANNDLLTLQRRAQQRVQGAATGQEVDTGSNLELTSDTLALGKVDSLRIVNNAEREALGFEAQGVNFEADARLQETSGKNAEIAGNAKATGTLISGAGKVAGKWYDFKKDGTF